MACSPSGHGEPFDLDSQICCDFSERPLRTLTLDLCLLYAAFKTISVEINCENETFDIHSLDAIFNTFPPLSKISRKTATEQADKSADERLFYQETLQLLCIVERVKTPQTLMAKCRVIKEPGPLRRRIRYNNNSKKQPSVRCGQSDKTSSILPTSGSGRRL